MVQVTESHTAHKVIEYKLYIWQVTPPYSSKIAILHVEEFIMLLLY